MADQNRKTGGQKGAREFARDIVDLFLEVLYSADSSIAWEGRTVIGALIDFRGQLPESSGFAGFCTLGQKVDRMHNWTPMQRMACRLVMKMSDTQVQAVCVDRAYRGRTKVAIDPFVPDRRVELFWSDEECAVVLECEPETFRKRVSDGYRRLEELISTTMRHAA